MDGDKLKLLQEEGYRIPRQCGLCIHGRFGRSSLFGICAIKIYKHGKHTGALRQMSIFRGGSCRRGFSPDSKKVKELQTYVQFLED